MALMNYLFTSESVTEGHPDKMCDNISDAILDAHLAGDPNARVACETAVKTGFVLIAGEITAHSKVDYPAVVREVAEKSGTPYNKAAYEIESRREAEAAARAQQQRQQQQQQQQQQPAK